MLAIIILLIPISIISLFYISYRLIRQGTTNRAVKRSASTVPSNEPSSDTANAIITPDVARVLERPKTARQNRRSDQRRVGEQIDRETALSRKIRRVQINAAFAEACSIAQRRNGEVSVLDIGKFAPEIASNQSSLSILTRKLTQYGVRVKAIAQEESITEGDLRRERRAQRGSVRDRRRKVNHQIRGASLKKPLVAEGTHELEDALRRDSPELLRRIKASTTYSANSPD